MRSNIFKIFLLCAAVLFISSAFSNSTNASESSDEAVSQDSAIYYVNAASGLNMRSEPSKSASVLTTLPNGATVVVTEQTDDGWYKIEYDGMTGYVSADYLQKAETDENEASEAIVQTEVETTEAQSETESEQTAQTTVNTSTSSGKDTFGASTVIMVLVVTIILMLLLAAFTIFSFFKRGRADYSDDEYVDDEDDVEYYNSDENFDTEYYPEYEDDDEDDDMN